MKVPTVPTVRVQPAGRAYEAGRVVPQENPQGRSAMEFGNALEAAGQTALRVEDILQERVDRAKAREADAKLSDMTRELLSSPKGYLHINGRDAIDSRDDQVKRLDSQRQALLDTLSPRQRELVADSDETRYQHARSAIDGHYARQVEAYDLGQREARAESLAMEAVESYFAPADPTAMQPSQDPQAPTGAKQVKRTGFEDARISALSEIEGLAKRRGLSPEATELWIKKTNDQISGAIISRLVDKGRALEAADYLALHGKEMTPLARTRLEKTVEDGGIKEQAQQLAVWLRPQGTVMEQIAVLDELHSKKHIPLEVRDEAERRLLHNANVKNTFQAQEGKKALEQAQVWMSLPANRGKSITVDMREKLAAFGQEGAFDLWVAQGGQFITTNEGLQRLMRLTDAELGSKYRTPEEVIRDFQTDLDPQRMEHLLLRWKKARGEALNPDDLEKVDRSEAVKAFLYHKGFFARFVDSDDKLAASRMLAFEEAVAARVNASPKSQGLTPGQLRTLKMKEVYSEDPITVGDKMIPLVMATPAERELWQTKTKSGLVVTPTLLAPADPAKSPLGLEVQTVVSLVDGTTVDLRPSVDADRLPTRDQIRASFFEAHGKFPTEQHVAEVYADERAEIEQRAKDAQRISTTENKLRAKALLDRLPFEVEQEFARRQSSTVRVRVLGQSVRRSASELAGITPKEDFRASLVSVLSRHDDELRRYGLTHAMAAQWVPDAHKLLPKDDELMTVEASYAGTNIPFSQFFTKRVPIRGKFDPSPTPAEVAEANALRKKYQKTEAK